MNTEIEAVDSFELYQKIASIGEELLEASKVGSVTRDDAAKVVRRHGFAAYVGGHHVAIHHADANGALVPPRLAIVTHWENDWQ